MVYEFDAVIFEWSARRHDRWTFVGLPEDVADDVMERGSAVARGFGSLRVDVAIGLTRWRTSIFPSDADRTYVLPLKKAVRVAQGVDTGDTVHVRLSLVDL